MTSNILIIDDEQSICTFLSLALEPENKVFKANTPEEAYARLKKTEIQLVLLDMMLGEFNGMDVLKEIKKNHTNISVIIMTAFGTIESSVKAMKNGAFTYLCKPLNLEELNIYIKQALEFQSLNERVIYLSHELEARYSYGDMIGKDEKMQQVYNLIEKLKGVDTSVLVTGESGTGKELVARAIHYSGKRKNENFVSVNCAAIPEGLLEEEFFGHKKGSFTGAHSDNKGKMDLANKGTLFLDEIGDMPLSLQAKLLRTLQQKEFSPIGSNEVKKIDIRIISASNKNLQQMVEDGSFRQDLFYRLRVFEISLPALKNRKQDIPLLSKHFIKKYNIEHGKNIQGMTDNAGKMIMAYIYPGNIRELANAIEYAVVMSDEELIDESDLPSEMSQILSSPNEKIDTELFILKHLTNIPLKIVEKMLIKANLEINNNKRKTTSKALEISERSLFYKIQEYGL